MSAAYFEVAENVWGLRDVMVNVYFIKIPTTGGWVLVDTGMKTGAKKILSAAEKLFGAGSKPSFIILTHGHFDHVSSVAALAGKWKVPVFAHYLEMPYLMGKADYAPGDPTVGGGLMSSLAFLYPYTPIDISGYLSILPADGTIDGLPGWRYIHTPGHAPGHISLFNDEHKILIAGDAFVTTAQESVLAIMTQKKILSGPPKYFTYDWEQAEASVKELAALQPKIAATGHGQPMQGAELWQQLDDLLAHFDSQAMPKEGRYVDDPAVANATGFVYVPPLRRRETKKWLIGAAIAISVAAVGIALASAQRKKSWIAGG